MRCLHGTSSKWIWSEKLDWIGILLTWNHKRKVRNGSKWIQTRHALWRSSFGSTGNHSGRFQNGSKSLNQLLMVQCTQQKLFRYGPVHHKHSLNDTVLQSSRVTIKTLFEHFLRSDGPQLSSACTKNQLSNVPSEIFNLKSNRPRNLHKQICNLHEQVVRARCKLLKANCQSKYNNIVAEVCKVAQKSQHLVWL